MKQVTQHDPVDVVIVGAGAAGCLFAQRFAEAGRAVRVLEAGPPWRLEDLYSSQLWARRLKWGGPPVLIEGQHHFGHNMATGWGYGGAALHHYGSFPRFHPEDFRVRSLYGRASDWPVTYDDLRPYYDRVQQQIGISGDAEAEVWRPPGAPYPMPPLPVFKQGRMIARGFEALGIQVSPFPLAINSRPYRGRPACSPLGWCDAGCAIGALANPLSVHFPPARKAGAQFQSWSRVTRLIAGKRGRVRGVEYRDREGGIHRQEAEQVVLAANGVQNVRLLLNSPCDWAASGMANSSGMVGDQFSCHSIANVCGVFPETTENYLGVTAGTLMSQDGYRKDARSGAFGSYHWGFGPALKPHDLLGIANTRADLYGTELVRFLEDSGPRLGVMAALCESMPEAGNRIELAQRRDADGLPLARVVHTFNQDALALWQHAVDEGIEVMRAAGAKEAWPGQMATTHIIGGTVMGTDPSTSVTDPFGRCHDVENLLIAGSGLFPTAGGGSPTFTLYALAERTADHLLGTTQPGSQDSTVTD